MATVVIDPGHGGFADAGRSTWRGVVGAGAATEKDLNLQLARRLRAHLGAGARLTRDADVNLPLAERAAIARRAGADVFISLHSNAGAPDARGTEVWVHESGSLSSERLAREVGASLRRLSGRDCAVDRGDLAVLAPRELDPRTASCLVEIGCLSTDSESRAQASVAGLDALGAGIAAGVRRFLAGAASPTFAGGRVASGGSPRGRFDRRAAGM